MNFSRKPQWKSDNWRGLQKAAVVYPLLATELNWHREKERMAAEIKRLRSEVGLITKRYRGAQTEIQDMVTRLRAQPPPPVPERGPSDTETEDTPTPPPPHTPTPTPTPTPPQHPPPTPTVPTLPHESPEETETLLQGSAEYAEERRRCRELNDRMTRYREATKDEAFEVFEARLSRLGEDEVMVNLWERELKEEERRIERVKNAPKGPRGTRTKRERGSWDPELQASGGGGKSARTGKGENLRSDGGREGGK